MLCQASPESEDLSDVIQGAIRAAEAAGVKDADVLVSLLPLLRLAEKGESDQALRSALAAIISDSAKSSAVAGGMAKEAGAVAAVVQRWIVYGKLCDADRSCLYAFAPLLWAHCDAIQGNIQSFRPWLRRVLSRLDPLIRMNRIGLIRSRAVSQSLPRLVLSGVPPDERSPYQGPWTPVDEDQGMAQSRLVWDCHPSYHRIYWFCRYQQRSLFFRIPTREAPRSILRWSPDDR